MQHYTLNIKQTILFLLLNLVIIQFSSANEPKKQSTKQKVDPITSGNPFIRHDRGADPSAQVWNDGQVWVYASHDQDDANGYESMDGYRVYSSYDLVNWTDHGEILHSRDVSWGTPEGGKMFAPDAAYKDGVYYLYFPHPDEGWNFKIGVATSTTPEGPFTDIGNYIEGTHGIDPTCFIDDDGTAYLMFGTHTPMIAKLKKNMIELAEEPRVIDYGTDGFLEAGYIHKYKDMYYFSYNCNDCWPNSGQYGMSDSPYGPYEHKGVVSDVPDGAQIHNSMIEYHGQWYYFYHMGSYNNGSLYRRNLCMDSMFYNSDGTIQKVIHTEEGVSLDLIGSTTGQLIPGQFGAESFYSQEGMDTVNQNDTTLLSNIQNGDWVQYVLDILGDEEYNFHIKALNPILGTTIFTYVNDDLVDSIIITEAMDTLSSNIFLHKGKHTLKLLFKNEDTSTELLEIDWLKLQGEITYYALESSANEGGIIEPDGLTYKPTGDSLMYVLNWESGYQPDSLQIDGTMQSPTNSYTFYNIAANHSIQANFVTCEGTSLNPSYKINDKEAVSGSEIMATEGNKLELKVDFDGEGEVNWINSNGYIATGNAYSINNAEVSQSDIYTAEYINSNGCKSHVDFLVQINHIVLDVYQAEDFIEQSGIQTEGCDDLGGGDNIGFIENNDWCTYEITIDSAGVYDFIARAATGTNGGSIELSIGDEILGLIQVKASESNGWQDWYTTDAMEVTFLNNGTETIKLTYKGSGGYLFNLNWFDLNYKYPVSSTSTKANSPTQIFPNPVKDQFSIVSDFEINKVEIYNLQGQKTYSTTVSNSKTNLSIDLPKGVYMVHVIGDKENIINKIIID